MHVLFVCATNLSLSPTAAAVLGELAAHQNRGLTTGSAAALPDHVGKPMPAHALKAAADRGIDLSAHVARRITPADYTDADLIVVFDRSDLRLLATDRPRGCRTEIRLFSSLLGKDASSDIVEPTGDDPSRYERSYELIESGVRDVLTKLRERLAAVAVEA